MGSLIIYILIGLFFYWIYNSYTRYQQLAAGSAGPRAVSPEQIRNSDLGLFVALMAKVAKADGRIDTLEAELIGNTFTDIAAAFQDPQSVREELKAIFNHEKEQRFNVDAIALRLQHATVTHPQQRMSMFAFLVNLAFIDGNLSRSEENLLTKIAAYLKLSSSQVDAVMARFANLYKSGPTHKSLEEAYRLLDANPDESFETIKKKYRTLVKKYHPDLMKARGADEAYIADATRKMQELNAAYEMIKAQKG